MLNLVAQVDENAVCQLMSLYSESMNEMKKHFASDAEMCEAYASFLQDFVINLKLLILVEVSDDEWVSALRAIETMEGHWFLEAVETKPEKRKKGFGKNLLYHTIDYLKNIGMKELTCTISKNNFKSQELHRKCGFLPTNEPSVNCWGELEEGTILYRLAK